ncbi:MAG: hypothetical protein HC804_10940 [Anaerolineae bacterium]|nr:hypothetical protein [Anaerolineae bacterium]
MSDEIIFSVENQIATLTVNRPEARNALNWVAQEQFADVITAVARTISESPPSIRVLIITGSGQQAICSWW